MKSLFQYLKITSSVSDHASPALARLLIDRLSASRMAAAESFKMLGLFVLLPCFALRSKAMHV